MDVLKKLPLFLVLLSFDGGLGEVGCHELDLGKSTDDDAGTEFTINRGKNKDMFRMQ